MVIGKLLGVLMLMVTVSCGLMRASVADIKETRELHSGINADFERLRENLASYLRFTHDLINGNLGLEIEKQINLSNWAINQALVLVNRTGNYNSDDFLDDNFRIKFADENYLLARDVRNRKEKLQSLEANKIESKSGGTAVYIILAILIIVLIEGYFYVSRRRGGNRKYND